MTQSIFSKHRARITDAQKKHAETPVDNSLAESKTEISEIEIENAHDNDTNESEREISEHAFVQDSEETQLKQIVSESPIDNPTSQQPFVDAEEEFICSIPGRTPSIAGHHCVSLIP